MSKKAAKFLRNDRRLKAIIDVNGVQTLRKRSDYFNVLVLSIANQQLSGKAADTIYGRLKKMCGGSITPWNIAKLRPGQIRKAGFSYPKVSYIKDLAEKFIKKEINPHKFHFQSDEQVLEELVKVKGIGRWTAEMFLMFSLGRQDVFPADDLGIKKAIARLYKMNDASSKNLDKFSRRWKPYRSYASLYLWKSIETKPPEGWALST